MTQLNPYRDPTPWGTVRIGGLAIPGTILSIDGAERPEEWDVQKPTEKSGATTVWKGTKVADAINSRRAAGAHRAQRTCRGAVLFGGGNDYAACATCGWGTLYPCVCRTSPGVRQGAGANRSPASLSPRRALCEVT